jgi:RHS repeat-associated protein
VRASSEILRGPDDRQRYLARARDATLPADQYDPYLEPLDDDPQDRFVRWSEYVGDQVHADFEMDLSGQTPVVDVAARYVHAGGADGALVAMDGGPGYTLNDRRFFHQDLLGTARLLTGANGAVTQSLAFSAFGGVVGTAPAGSPRYGYAGAWGYQDDALGTPGWTGPAALHVGARYYDPALGRFLGRDPMGIFGGVNAYGYGLGNPVSMIDPSGRFTLGEVATTVAIGATLGGLSNGVQSGSWSWKDAAVGAAGGAVGMGVGLINPTLGGAAGGFTGGLVSCAINWEAPGWRLVGSTLAGALVGYFSGFMTEGGMKLESSVAGFIGDVAGNICTNWE